MEDDPKAPMTDFDLRLIEKAQQFPSYYYRFFDTIIRLADTREARLRLADIRNDLYELVCATL